MITKIESLDNYIDVMNELEAIVQTARKKGGFDALKMEETQNFERLSLLANAYEKQTREVSLNKLDSITDAIRIKMMHLRLKQKEMAELLGIAESRLSEVLSGKRRVNMDLAKKLHTILKIEAEFILQTA
jgi:HTH-type transcriptional regulator / antitoxin HigA